VTVYALYFVAYFGSATLSIPSYAPPSFLEYNTYEQCMRAATAMPAPAGWQVVVACVPEHRQ
jgi:hypothetical protein